MGLSNAPVSPTSGEATNAALKRIGSDPNDPVGNFLAEVEDLNSRPDLLSESDKRFLKRMADTRVRTFADMSNGLDLSMLNWTGSTTLCGAS